MYIAAGPNLPSRLVEALGPALGPNVGRKVVISELY